MRLWCFKRAGEFMGVSLVSGLLWTATEIIPAGAQLSHEESEHVAEVAKSSPRIALEIYFDPDSAAITSKAEPQMNELCDALRSPQLQNSVIEIAGHTDARGSAAYKQQLSERRAEAVKQYLVGKCKLSDENLVTRAYGFRVPKNEADPYAAENNRVEIVNLSAAAQK
jgi:outer membrane protein OmpA-like peptidoglycan-associated protein